MDRKAATLFFRNFKDRAIHAFVFFHIVTIACWCLPLNTSPVLVSRALVRPYFLWSGLFQAWDMFSPAPKRTNSYLEAMLVYPDGRTAYWPFPRMNRLTLTERYAKERYRKFEENLIEENNAELWPDAARYIARQAAHGADRPERVLLIVNWSDLVQEPDGSFNGLPWQSRVFFSYRVEPEDFR